MTNRNALIVFAVVSLAACAKPLDAKLADIPALATLEDVMHANETIGGKQWGKAGDSSFSDAEFAELKDTAAKMQALAERTKNFSRGPAFDKYADKMVGLGKALGTAADAKDGPAAGKAIADMKQTCKDCHAETR